MHFFYRYHIPKLQLMQPTFFDNVFKLHELPTFIFSDRDAIFTSRFSQELFKLQGIKLQSNKPHLFSEAISSWHRDFIQSKSSSMLEKCLISQSYHQLLNPPAFHVSLLKKIGDHIRVQPILSPVREVWQIKLEPVAMLDRRMVKCSNRAMSQFLIQWSNSFVEVATLEDWEMIQSRFPDFKPQIKAGLKGREC